MKTLVTGAAGFIGNHLTKKLVDDGQSVRALVRKTEQCKAWRDLGVEVIVGDVRQPDVVEKAVQGVDVVQHCAAATGPKYSKEEIYSTNLDGVQNVLESLRRSSSTRLVLISSINVLGSRDLQHATEDLPCHRVNDPHADVKIDAEALVLKYQHEHGVEATILRPGLVYGPGEPNVPRLLDAIRQEKFAYIGSRDNVVPMVHIDDLLQAMQLAARASIANGRIYHITDGVNITIGEVIDYLAKLIDYPSPKKVLPYFIPYMACLAFDWLGHLRLVKGHGPITRVGLRFLGTSRMVEIRRARDELGYDPKVAFHDGIARTVNCITQKV